MKQQPIRSMPRNAGYTIDQTILIVAVIAILITIIVATVGWDIISRANGTKMAAQMRQIEDSVGQFYAAHSVWPHRSAPSADTNVPATLIFALMGGDHILVNSPLTGSNGGFLPVIDTEKLRNYLPGFEQDGTYAYHTFGSAGSAGGGAGSIQMHRARGVASLGVGTNEFYVVEMRNVPFDEAVNADKAIDGEEDSQQGRVYYFEDDGSAACTDGTTVTLGTPNSDTDNVMCYVANMIQ